RGRNGPHKDLAEGQLVERRRVDDQAGTGAGKTVDRTMGPVLGHKRILYYHLFAAGPAQTPGMPVIIDADVGARNQESPVVGRACPIVGRNDSAKKKPVG